MTAPEALRPAHVGEPAGPLVQGRTAPEGLRFHLAEGQDRLATPWQVAAERSSRLSMCNVPDGIILDPACGSGIQVATHCIALDRACLGIEIDPKVAVSASANIWRSATFERSDAPKWLANSHVIIANGTDAEACLEAAGNPAIGLLHIDPARPVNSRTHGLEEMQPLLPDVFAAWAPFLGQNKDGPALLLDLSPRLLDEQCAEVEGMVSHHWPDSPLTWEWTSRGAGRIDRLSLWVGGASQKGVGCRFVRIPPAGEMATFVIHADAPRSTRLLPKVSDIPGRRGEWLTVIDAALVSSGLADVWLSKVLAESDSHRWLEVDGRRPIIAHSEPLNLRDERDRLLVQCSGQLVTLLRLKLNQETVAHLAESALEERIGKLSLRLSLSPEDQPRLQGALHRIMGKHKQPQRGFVLEDPVGSHLLLCRE